MELVSKKVGEAVVVGLSQPGSLEANNAEDFRDTITNLLGNTAWLVIDMSNVSFLDSSGLAAIIAVWRNIATRGGEMKLCKIEPEVSTVLELTGVRKTLEIYDTSPVNALEYRRKHRVFEIYDTEEEALASLPVGETED